MKYLNLLSTVLFLSTLMCHQITFAQDWEWANYIPWSFNVPTRNTPVYIDVYTRAVSHDGAGNAYATGYIDVEDGDNGDDASVFFVSKFNAAGQPLWHKQYGAPFGPEAHGEDIVADANGNIYVIGYFSGTLSFTNSLTLASTGGSNDIFIAKYNTFGNVLWAKNIGSSSADKGYGIAIDNQGNIVVTGNIFGAIYFGNGVWSFDFSPNSSDYFIAKLDNSGNALWVRRSASSETASARGKRISVDYTGQIWSVGSFREEVTLENITLTATPAQSGKVYDMFVAKHDASGNLLWAKNFGGSESEWFADITCDQQGNAYTTGTFYGNIALDNVTLTSSSQAGFIAKINSAGNTVWAKKIGGNSYTEAGGVGVDASDNCYVAGSVNGKIFVNKYIPNGNLDWTKEAKKHYTSNGGEVFANDISTDNDGNSYVAGMFHGDLISFENFNLSGSHGDQPGYAIQQGLVAKLSATDLFFPPEIDPGVWEEWPLPPLPDPVSRLKAFPNPSDDIVTLHFQNPGRNIGYLGIYNQRGVRVHLQEFRGDLEQRFSLGRFGTGHYYGIVIAGEEKHIQTIIIE